MRKIDKLSCFLEEDTWTVDTQVTDILSVLAFTK